MIFSILTWNIWYKTQIDGEARLNALKDELTRLNDRYKPDFIALNEVVKPANEKVPAVIKHLDKLGYDHHHYGEMLELPGCWTSSASLSSRYKLNDKRLPVISEQVYANNRGYPGYDREVVCAQVDLPDGRNLKIISAHPHATVDSLKVHFEGMRNLQKLIREETYSQNTIMLGDMNEWRFIPGAFRHKVRDVMHARTGTILKPTWVYDARRFAPLRANLDYVYWGKQSDFRLKDFKVISSDISDHRPLLATFEYLPT